MVDSKDEEEWMISCGLGCLGDHTLLLRFLAYILRCFATSCHVSLHYLFHLIIILSCLSWGFSKIVSHLEEVVVRTA